MGRRILDGQFIEHCGPNSKRSHGDAAATEHKPMLQLQTPYPGSGRVPLSSIEATTLVAGTPHKPLRVASQSDGEARLTCPGMSVVTGTVLTPMAQKGVRQ